MTGSEVFLALAFANLLALLGWVIFWGGRETQLREAIPEDIRKREGIVNGKWQSIVLAVTLATVTADIVSGVAPELRPLKDFGRAGFVLASCTFAIAAFRVVRQQPAETELCRYARLSGWASVGFGLLLATLLVGERWLWLSP